MKKFSSLTLTLSFIIALGITACHKSDDIIEGNGNIMVSNPSIGHFSAIDLRLDGALSISLDSTYAIEVSDYENILSKLSFKIENDVLIITTTDANTILHNSNLQIHISAPDSLLSIRHSQDGKISIDGDFTRLNSVSLAGLHNTLDTKQAIHANTLTLNLFGTGYMTCLGTANQLNMNISGFGFIATDSVIAQNAYCNISGEGDIRTRVVQHLDVIITGSGTVGYYGTPSITDDILGGIGEIIKLD